MGRSFINSNIPNLPLGLRNNNPGNIRPGDNWKGMIGVNKNFVVFENIQFGIRAMATDLIGDIVRKGKNTLTALINEYAPPSENNTQAYINNMVKFTGIGANEKINPDLPTMKKILRGVMNVELGVNYSKLITDQEIEEGLRMVSTSLLQRIKNFFVNNPEVTAASGVGIVAVLIVVLVIFVGKVKFNDYD